MQLQDIVKRVKNWFPKAQEKLQDQANELEAKFTDSELNPLSAEQLHAIQKDIAALPHPQPYQRAIRSKLSELLTRWQQGGDHNCLVVLCHSTENIGSLFHQVLSSSAIDDSFVIHTLPWSHRPEDYSTILTQLQGEIAPTEDDTPPHQFRVIPDLSWCFLRCLYGLDGIEWLQKTLFQDQSQFWLIGCNYWSWQYLNCVYQWDAYFEQILELPALEPIEIKQWLQPVTEKLAFNFEENTDSSQPEDSEEEVWNSKAERRYFERLAKVSLGTGSTVAQLWLNSLCQQEAEEQQETPEAHISAESQSQSIILARVDLPKLPQLNKEDRYLLFSLGLHGNMTLNQLTVSLGDRMTLVAAGEGLVQAQVQVLRRAGLIQNQQGWLSIAPIHYPRLERDLKDNQFLVD